MSLLVLYHRACNKEVGRRLRSQAQSSNRIYSQRRCTSWIDQLLRAPPPARNQHMTLCTEHWLCALTGERVKVAPNQRERGRRRLINDHMLGDISSRQIP
ncbi:hypothetical protein EYF80_001287 [Liparis tanakae]|uniref:Uncharacterized protein n=1 Tax=Liparis tanakae TaxID=230148 RepID=A0A4Z2JFB4_9TELE|nr:hypothetical protein EYF80_001287 [Liparis tanakae]